MIKLLSSAATAIVVTGLMFATPARADYSNITGASDPVLYWNTFVVNLPGGPPAQGRAAAMVNIAMHDAVNAALGNPNNSYLMGVPNSGGDARVAAAQAAHDVLVKLNGGSSATYDSALSTYLSSIPDSAAKTSGQATGTAYANAIWTARMNDGSATAGGVPYVPNGNLYDWQPTPPANLAAALPGWGQVTPFLLDSASQFRAGPPPALGSAEYIAAYNEVKLIGAAGALASGDRSQDQQDSALFWNGANGTTWVKFGLDIAETKGLSTLEYAQLFATLTSSLADAFIAGFDTKYTYDFWRPITAIRAGDADGVGQTVGDAGWTSLINAPNHPSYLSTHSIASGAASTVLASFFGDQPFGGGQFCETVVNLSRCFTSFSGAAQDGANSRLWGGIHFSFDNAAGLTAGRSVGAFALTQAEFRAVPEPSTWALLLLGFGLVGWRMRRLAGARTQLTQLA